MKPYLTYASTTLIALLFTLNSCSGVKEVQSYFNSNSIVIDGLKNDWEGKLNFDSKSKLAVGFQNDKENIFLCITTNDRANIMKILRLGLTIWFEPKGDGKTIGIKYPLFDMERMRNVPLRNELPDNERENPDERFKKMILSQNEISIVNEDDYPLFLVSNNDEKNIQAKIDVSKETFVYEIKIPLSTNKQAKYFIESAPSEKIKIGIVTNELKLDSPIGRPGKGMNRGDGKQPSQGESSGRRPQGMPEGRNFGMNTDPIKLWYEVKLTD